LIHKGQDMEKWQVPTNTIMSPWGPHKVQEFLIKQGSLSFSQMA